MQVVLCQLDTVWEDKPASHAAASQLLASLAIEPGALIVLPEMWATGFSMHVDRTAEPAAGPTHAFMSELARDRAAYVLGGVVRLGNTGRGRNEAVLFATDGQEAARYCKMHPFSFAGETKHFESGEGITVFEWQGFKVAPLVCYDLRFPELFRHAVSRGAEMFVVIANWPQVREEHWMALLRARAIENQAFVFGVNRSGADPHASYGGKSLAIGPRGETIAEGGRHAEAIVCNISRDEMQAYRQTFPALADMRRDLLGGNS